MRTLATHDLLGITTGSDPLPKRALALCYAIGTDRRPSDHPHPRAGEPQAAFDYVFEAGFPASAVEIAREGHFKIGEPLCNFLPVLGSLLPPASHELTDDVLPPERMIGEAPSWAFDIFTREGRGAIGDFSRGTARPVAGRRSMSQGTSASSSSATSSSRSRAAFSSRASIGRWARFCGSARSSNARGPGCPTRGDRRPDARRSALLNKVRAHVR